MKINGKVKFRLWWVIWEEWESGECYTTRNTQELVCADSAQRAVEIIMEQNIPNWIGDTHFDCPVAMEFIAPTNEGVVSSRLEANK